MWSACLESKHHKTVIDKVFDKVIVMFDSAKHNKKWIQLKKGLKKISSYTEAHLRFCFLFEWFKICWVSVLRLIP